MYMDIKDIISLSFNTFKLNVIFPSIFFSQNSNCPFYFWIEVLYSYSQTYRYLWAVSDVAWFVFLAFQVSSIVFDWRGANKSQSEWKLVQFFQPFLPNKSLEMKKKKLHSFSFDLDNNCSGLLLRYTNYCIISFFLLLKFRGDGDTVLSKV